MEPGSVVNLRKTQANKGQLQVSNLVHLHSKLRVSSPKVVDTGTSPSNNTQLRINGLASCKYPLCNVANYACQRARVRLIPWHLSPGLHMKVYPLLDPGQMWIPRWR